MTSHEAAKALASTGSYFITKSTDGITRVMCKHTYLYDKTKIGELENLTLVEHGIDDGAVEAAMERHRVLP